MRILVAQLNPTIGDIEGNGEKILHALDRAREEKVEVVLFSELVLSGYPPEDLLLHPAYIDAQEAYLDKIVKASSGMFVAFGMARHNRTKGEKIVFNSAAIMHDGKLLGFEDKILLPTYDVFDERRYFEPGAKVHVWPYKGKKIGLLICEDMWQHAGAVPDTHYARDPVEEIALLKPDLLLNLSASPYHDQKPDVRIGVCVKAAKRVGVPIVMSCQVGGNDQLVFDGYSLWVDAQGRLQQVAKGFEEDFLIIDSEKTGPASVFYCDPIQDLFRALALGTSDYLRKLGFQKVVIGLSGGIDSAVVACIAVHALGRENVLGVFMPSRFSSPSSISDAEALAKNLGIETLLIPIERPFQVFLDLLEPHFGNRAFDVTEENMQARIRGTILMSLSNKFGHIVLSTGNKSEVAMGYCTLYGDMVGGLAIISDVTKKQVYELARFINREREIIPENILHKEPSAELKPEQKDSDALPDYDIVDQVLKEYVEDYLTPKEIARRNDIPLELVTYLVHGIHKAEYKRQQAAIGIRVSKKSFKAGRRYPIVQRWVE